jgi:hypothetical protein
MNLQSWFWLLLGLFVIYGIYRKALGKNGIETTIKVYSEPGTPEKVANSAKPRLAKLQKELFASVALLSAALYTLVVTNLVFDYLKGWYVLGLCGLVISYLYLKSETLPTFALLNSRESGIADEYRISQENLKSSRFISARNTSLGVVIATLVFSGNWAYQVQKNQTEAKLWAMNEMNNLVGTGWCENFWNIDATPGPDGDYDVSKTGGWPCITIGSVSNIRFQDSGKALEMCLNYSLSRSVGPPSDSDNLSEYAYESICSSDDSWEWAEGWDKDSVRRKIGDELNIMEALEQLQVQMCRNYYFGMSVDERGTYCYGVL